MAANKVVRMGPVAMVLTTPTNIVVAPTLTGAVGLSNTNTSSYLIIKHVKLVNKTGTAAVASLFIGATGGSAAGTEFFVSGTSIPANSSIDWYGQLRLEPTDFLTGFAGTTAAITFEAEGEIGVV